MSVRGDIWVPLLVLRNIWADAGMSGCLAPARWPDQASSPVAGPRLAAFEGRPLVRPPLFFPACAL
jgi:hypothetical protein